MCTFAAFDSRAALVDAIGKGAAVSASVDTAAEIAKTKTATASKEKAILSVMAGRQAALAKEKRALDLIKSEMAALAKAQYLEINEVGGAGRAQRDKAVAAPRSPHVSPVYRWPRGAGTLAGWSGIGNGEAWRD